MANSTRDVVGVVRHSNGKAWEGGAVLTRLVTAWAEDDTQPADEQEWLIANTGAVEMTLAVPDTGTVAYEFELPSGETFTANLDLDDGSDLDLETLVEGGGLAPEDIDTTLAMINARLAPAFVTLTDGATITWDFDNYPLRNAKVTLGGNRTLAITNIASGAAGILIVTQDGSGGHSLALPAGSKVIESGAGVIPLSSGAGDIDILSFIYDGSTFFWTYGSDYTGA